HGVSGAERVPPRPAGDSESTLPEAAEEHRASGLEVLGPVPRGEDVARVADRHRAARGRRGAPWERAAHVDGFVANELAAVLAIAEDLVLHVFAREPAFVYLFLGHHEPD